MEVDEGHRHGEQLVQLVLKMGSLWAACADDTCALKWQTIEVSFHARWGGTHAVLTPGHGPSCIDGGKQQLGFARRHVDSHSCFYVSVLLVLGMFTSACVCSYFLLLLLGLLATPTFYLLPLLFN